MNIALTVAATAALLASQAAGAAGSIACDPAPGWDGFSSISVTVQGSGGDELIPEATTFTVSVHDDGIRTVAQGPATRVPARIEMIELDRPQGRVLVASDPSVPLQLGEVGMVFELPLGALKRQFQSPCDLRADRRYPVDLGTADDAVTGEFQLQGGAIHYRFDERRGAARLSYVGRIDYERARGVLPADLAIRGWTMFRHGGPPEEGVAVPFDTLADLRRSLAASTAQ